MLKQYSAVAFGARTEIGDPAFVDNAQRIKEIASKKYGRELHSQVTDVSRLCSNRR